LTRRVKICSDDQQLNEGVPGRPARDHKRFHGGLVYGKRRSAYKKRETFTGYIRKDSQEEKKEEGIKERVILI
jgi:hypothetical protein